MTILVADATGLLALLVYVVAILGVVAVMYVGSYFLGQRHTGRATNEPYESGIKSTGATGVRFPAKFYLVAMSFVIFDLEVAFLFGWAVVAGVLGWTAYVGMLVFAAILAIGLVYEWRMRTFDFITEEFRALRSGRRSL